MNRAKVNQIIPALSAVKGPSQWEISQQGVPSCWARGLSRSRQRGIIAYQRCPWWDGQRRSRSSGIYTAEKTSNPLRNNLKVISVLGSQIVAAAYLRGPLSRGWVDWPVDWSSLPEPRVTFRLAALPPKNPQSSWINPKSRRRLTLLGAKRKCILAVKAAS